MIRVLLVITAREIGGAELNAERMIKALATECQFTVALSDHPKMRGFSASLGRFARVLTFPFDDPARLLTVVRDIRRLAASYDLVHVNSNHPASRLGVLMAFASGGRQVPVICVEQGATRVSDVRVPRTVAWAMPTLFRWSRRKVARVIAVSQDNARMLIEHYRLPASLVEVVYNCVDLDPYRQSRPALQPSLREELGLRSDQPIILVLARLAAPKGHRFLIQAAPTILGRFPNAHFVFAGNPDGRAALDRQIAELNLRTKFSILGFRTDVADLLFASNVFVLPSLAEGFSLSVIEAMAAGLPVVATRVGGAAEIVVDEENGFLVPPSDADALSRAVIRVLSQDGASRAQTRSAALKTAQMFSSQETARQMLAIYKKVVRLQSESGQTGTPSRINAHCH